MPNLFPDCPSDADFERIRRDDPLLRPGVLGICAAEGLEGDIERFPDGSLPVYAIGDSLVLKLYPPVYIHERHTEAAVLAAVAGRLAVPTPQVVANDVLEGWGYLLMSRLRGVSLAHVWDDIARSNQLHLARQLGESLAALHRCPAPALESVCIDWSEFVAEQERTALDRQHKRNLDSAWAQQVPDFLLRTQLPAPSSASALLHTEVMREHLLVERAGDSWQLSGLFDFEPAMRGAAEYEFASVGLFFSCGDREVLRAVLREYGYEPAQLDGALSRRLLKYTLLHRYSNLPWYLSRLPENHGMSTLDELADHWFGTATADR